MPPPTAPSLQLSWLDGEALAWRPHQRAGGALRGGAVGVATSGVRVVKATLPHGTVEVIAQRLLPESLAVLGQHHTFDGEPSPSLAWFVAMHRYAATLVRAGRVVPAVSNPRQNVWVARWQLIGADVDEALALFTAMPPVVAAMGPVNPADVLGTLADALARAALTTLRYRPVHLARGRDRALRLVAHALSSYDAQFVAHRDYEDELVEIAVALHQVRQRAEGVPVLSARLRLALPAVDAGDLGGAAGTGVDGGDGPAVGVDDADEARWPLTLEVVNSDDRSRWCTAGDVRAGNDAALAVAGERKFLDGVERQLADAEEAVRAAIPALGSWLVSEAATVDLDGAAAVLSATEPLARSGVSLVVPEGLARKRPAHRATAQPKGEGSGRFNAQAIVSWQATVDGEPADETALARIAAGGATLLQVGGRWVQVDRRDAQRALAALEQHRATHHELTALQLMTLAAELSAELESAGEATEAPVIDASGWVGDLLAGLPDETIGEGTVPDGFRATLRPYQRRGLGWLQFLQRLGLGGCLADDMGLGKTPTTLAHLAGTPGPHLVICPLSVVRNWQSEAARFAPDLRVMVHHGGGRHGADTLAEAVGEHDLVVTTYQIATRDIAHLADHRWVTVVLDEAQAIKNADTHTARAVRKLQAGQRIALTGTPVENRLSELWSIMHTVTPGLLGGAADFRRRYATPIEKSRDAEAAGRLRQLTSPFLLRRTKADRTLVPDLPDKIEQVAWATLTHEQAHLYQQVVDQLLHDALQEKGMKRRGIVLAALTRLKQICNHPAHALGDGSRLAGRSGKLNRFDELVAGLLDAGEQALVFTQFREMGLLLQRHLAETTSLQVPFLHGGVVKGQRDRMVDQFQAGRAAPLLLVSLKAGGTGLNLTAASRVVHYDRWWNPAVEDQATDRAWRIGQRQAVFVHKLVCQGTVEEKIDALITDKRGLADAVVGSTGEAWLSELSTDELRDLVALQR